MNRRDEKLRNLKPGDRYKQEQTRTADLVTVDPVLRLVGLQFFRRYERADLDDVVYATEVWRLQRRCIGLLSLVYVQLNAFLRYVSRRLPKHHRLSDH